MIVYGYDSYSYNTAMNAVPWSKLLTCEMFDCWFIGNM